MRIPILQLKSVLDSLLNWAKLNYLYYNSISEPENSWLYDVFNGNSIGNFDYYQNAVSLLTRGGEDSNRLETRMMYDTSRSTLPTIHIHLPGESEGRFTSIDRGLGYGGLNPDNTVFEGKANSSVTNYELIITGANSEEIILIYELLYALFIAGHETLQNAFETFSFSGAELMANPEVIPYQTFYRSFQVSVGFERVVKSIVSYPTIIGIDAQGKPIRG